MNQDRTQGGFWRLWERFGLLLVIAVCAVGLSVSSPNFLTAGNFKNFINQAAVVAIAGAGMTLAIASGAFDLSVGSIFAIAACIGANTVLHAGVASSLLASCSIGLVIGVVNGLIITKLKVPPFIGTLGMMAILRGVVLIYTGGRDINIMTEPAREAAYKFVGGGHVFFFPTPIVIMAAVFAALWIVLERTPFGRHVLAVGSNEDAAVRSGLAVDRIKITVFAVVGLTAAISAVIRTSQLMGVNGGTSGVGFELETISIVVLGGTSLRGGRGKLLGTMLGAILVAMVNNGLNLHNTPMFYQYLVMGGILLLAVSVDGLKSRFTQPPGVWTEV